MRRIVALAAVVLLAVSGCEKKVQAPDSGYPACATEDDMRDCYWDAKTQGNGNGKSFIRSGGNTFIETSSVPIGKWFIEYKGRVFVETTDGR